MQEAQTGSPLDVTGSTVGSASGIGVIADELATVTGAEFDTTVLESTEAGAVAAAS